MKNPLLRTRAAALVLGTAVVLLQGCSKSGDGSRQAAPRNPNEAASQLGQAFVRAAPEIKHNADLASEAMRKGDYEKAVVALQVIRSSTNITLEQGLAIHNSVVAMEGKLIRAMDAGDENAKRAYQLLKELKRN
ncbi:MAG: hypothetical protein DME19_11655 [Verrucomicrobia bacterium]|nr:MAG: hypothetical protein DME19_11655 [Verrucomicrobiota bacterium]